MRNNLYSARKRFGYNQEQAADYVGMSREQWNRIERGRCEPSITTALKIAASFEMAVEELFELEDCDWEKTYSRRD